MLSNGNYKHLVYVECMTYNQSDYIEDALHGFVMQRTNFPFVCMVMDDASTDGEQKIIKSFLEQEFDLAKAYRFEDEEAETIVVKHNTNDNCTFVFCLLRENHWSTKQDKEHLLNKWKNNSKYIAICEGDDYWTDSLKLQRQVKYMESHPDCSMVTENGIWLHITTGEQRLFSDELEHDVTFDDLLIQRRFPTASVLYRTIYLDEIFKLTPPVFDTLLWTCLSRCGRIHYNPVVSSVYRRGCGVTEHDRILWAYTVRDFNKSINRNFDVPKHIKKIRNEDVQHNLFIGFKDACKRRRYLDSIKLLMNCIMINPRYIISKVKKHFI